MKYLYGALALLLVQVLVGLALLYSGTVNVAASEPHTPLVRWVLETGKEQSIRHYAQAVSPPSLTLAPRADQGLATFREMCVTCHGAPGVERSALGKGLRPQGPELSEVARHMSPQELFWVVKHGIKMTGMPAWGETHSDEELWAVVAFLEQLPSLSSEEYQALVQRADGQAHTHGHGGGGH